MITEFIFTLGLPGCGKSTYLDSHYINVFNYGEWNKYFMYNQAEDPRFAMYCENLVTELNAKNKKNPNAKPGVIQIAADELKPFLTGYTDEHPEVVHEDSVQLAKKLVCELADDDAFADKVIMDGGAINNHYTSDIIEYIRKACPECKVTCIFFDVPVNVCLKRIEGRARKVPVSNIYEKNLKITSCVHKYKKMVDNFIRVDYYTNKYILLDMDGTIAAYGKVKRDADGNADFVNGELFRNLRPVKWVIDYVKANYDMQNVYIVSACPNLIAWNEKCAWLDEFFPEIPKENRYFCGNKDYKDVFVKQLALMKGWHRNEIVLVDDYHKTIDDCIKQNINCLHPSNIEAITDPYAIFSH